MDGSRGSVRFGPDVPPEKSMDTLRKIYRKFFANFFLPSPCFPHIMNGKSIETLIRGDMRCITDTKKYFPALSRWPVS